ncbi:hypothetical protein DFJ74DRAFT_741917, partial [Hyaloraphidium curvatum]
KALRRSVPPNEPRCSRALRRRPFHSRRPLHGGCDPGAAHVDDPLERLLCCRRRGSGPDLLQRCVGPHPDHMGPADGGTLTPVVPPCREARALQLYPRTRGHPGKKRPGFLSEPQCSPAGAAVRGSPPQPGCRMDVPRGHPLGGQRPAPQPVHRLVRGRPRLCCDGELPARLDRRRRRRHPPGRGPGAFHRRGIQRRRHRRVAHLRARQDARAGDPRRGRPGGPGLAGRAVPVRQRKVGGVVFRRGQVPWRLSRLQGELRERERRSHNALHRVGRRCHDPAGVGLEVVVDNVYRGYRVKIVPIQAFKTDTPSDCRWKGRPRMCGTGNGGSDGLALNQ